MSLEGVRSDDLAHSILYDLLVRLGLHAAIAADAPPILDTILHYSVNRIRKLEAGGRRSVIRAAHGDYQRRTAYHMETLVEDSPAPVAIIDEEHLLIRIRCLLAPNTIVMTGIRWNGQRQH